MGRSSPRARLVAYGHSTVPEPAQEGEIAADARDRQQPRGADALARLRTAYDADAARRATVEPDPWRLEIVDAFAASIRGGQRVIDLGCGAGQLARRLLDAGLDVTAIDLSPAMVRRTLERGVAALVADLRRLPFRDASFDGALAFTSIVHTPPDELGGLFAEVRRILVPGAILTVVVWGGRTHQGPIADEWLDPPRWFWMRSDDDVAALDTPGFARQDLRFLHHLGRDGVHPQVLTLVAEPDV